MTLRVLGAVSLALVLIGIAAEIIVQVRPDSIVASVASRMLLDAETTIPAWFSSVLLLACAPLLIWVGSFAVEQRWRLWILAALFIALSADETVMIHELGNGLMDKVVLDFDSEYPLWVVPGVLFVAALAWYVLPLLRTLPQNARRLWVLAAGVYVGGAIGVETVGSFLRVHDLPYAYIATVAIEEGMEMAGLVIFLYGLLVLLRQEGQALEVSVR